MTQKTLEEQTAEVLALSGKCHGAAEDCVRAKNKKNLSHRERFFGSPRVMITCRHMRVAALCAEIALAAPALLRQWQERCEALQKAHASLVRDNDFYREQNTTLQRRVDRMLEALEWYSGEEAWWTMGDGDISKTGLPTPSLLNDKGKAAKQALADDGTLKPHQHRPILSDSSAAE